ncbi:MAG: YHYH protein [Alphaproteobacteria bacterium]|nr:YHYH protein [Alphaproteobacteria bacterium]
MSTFLLALIISCAASSGGGWALPGMAGAAVWAGMASPPVVPAESDLTDCPQANDFLLGQGEAPVGQPAPSLSVRCEGGQVVVRSNGIPGFDFVQVTPNALRAQSYTWRLPAEPRMAARPTDVPLGGPSAVAVNGLPIFGPTEAPHHGYRDPVLDELLDYCNGHTAPGGVYHFHARPDCLFESTKGEVGLVVGYAFDGIPILAPWVCKDGGCAEVLEVHSSYRLKERTYGATITNAWDAHEYVEGLGQLDRCNGTTLADGRYVYFATDTFPYFMGCYAGEVERQNLQRGVGGGGPPPGRPPMRGG